MCGRYTMFILPLIVMQLAAVLAEMPPIQKCQLSDSSCLKTSAQAALPMFTRGMPEIGAEVLDVMNVDHIKVDLAGLKLYVTDCKIKGMKNSQIVDLSVDMANQVIKLVYDVELLVKSHYNASGRLLILPISGDGEMTLKIKKLHTDMIISFDLSKSADGKDIISPKSFKYTSDFQENVYFNLTNLFNGNKVLSVPLLKFMNENWKALTMEFGRSMLDKPHKKIYQSIKKYLSSQPMENIVEDS